MSDTGLDEILEKHSLDVLRAAGIAYKRKLHEDNLLIIDKKTKAEIEQKLNEARIEELKHIKINLNDTDNAVTYAAITGRIQALQASKEKL